jgi:hypothetical protein
MAELTATDLGRIMSQIDDAPRQSGGQFRANLLVQVATLTLLIDKSIITADEAVQRIEETQRAYPEIFDREDVTSGIKWAIDLLRGEVPLHGPILDQEIQRRARAEKALGAP